MVSPTQSISQATTWLTPDIRGVISSTGGAKRKWYQRRRSSLQDIPRCQPTYDHLKYLEKPDMSVAASATKGFYQHQMTGQGPGKIMASQVDPPRVRSEKREARDLP